MAKNMSTSRTGRLAKIGTLAGTQAARHAATRTANMVRSDERAQAAIAARNAEMAERLVIVLGTMRGAAMKFGQMLSMMDGGLIPEGQREEFQRKLAALQDKAPDVPWKKMRAHIEGELGEKLTAAFAEFGETPVAAASIGQVYRARLHDGRDVAVKVQYPGIDAAVRADLKNISMFLAAYSRFMHEGLDGKELAAELGERIMEELDYELEASNTRAMARAYRDHPFIRVPNVVTEVSSQRVLTTEWIDGRPLSSVYDAPLETRNRIAEILFRFYIGGPYRLRTYSGDPHPGNSLVLPDGSVGFLDFGLVKTVDRDVAEGELASFRATAEGDAPRLVQILHERGFIPDPAAASPEVTLAAMMHASHWYLRDAEIEITPAVANDIASQFADPRTEIGTESRKNNLPADHAFRGRAELHLAAILGQLRPRINLHPVAREWIYGDDPVTELGVAQRAWERKSGRLVTA